MSGKRGEERFGFQSAFIKHFGEFKNKRRERKGNQNWKKKTLTMLNSQLDS